MDGFHGSKRRKKKILTCYQTRNKHATSIMQKLLKKLKKLKIQEQNFHSGVCGFASSIFIVLLKKEKKILSIAIIFRIFLEEPHRSFKKTIKKN